MSDDLDTRIRAIWERSRPEVEERLALLDRAATDPALSREAERAAHKLAGSLGSFGYAEGSRIAARIEVAAAAGRPFGDDVAALRAALEH